MINFIVYGFQCETINYVNANYLFLFSGKQNVQQMVEE